MEILSLCVPACQPPHRNKNSPLTNASKTIILFFGMIFKEVRGLVSRMLFFGGLMTVYAENIKGNASFLAFQGGSLPKNAAKEPLSCTLVSFS
jgi:hypothetical protein